MIESFLWGAGIGFILTLLLTLNQIAYIRRRGNGVLWEAVLFRLIVNCLIAGGWSAIFHWILS